MKKFFIAAFALASIALALVLAHPNVGKADTSSGPSGSTVVISGDCAGSGRASIALNCSAMVGVKAEAWDADLDAIAVLSSPATLISGAAQKSNNGSDFSNLTTFRSNVGLAIGTNVEAWDADLDALAALGSTAGILKRTGAGAFGLAVSNTDYLPVASPTATGTMNVAGLTASSIVKQSGGGAGSFRADGASATSRGFEYLTSGVARWIVLADAATESGSNVGTNYKIQNYDDGGTNIGTPFSITRSTGLVTMANGATINGGLTLGTALADAQIASASTWNAKLGSSAIGSTVQAWDTDLDQFAALTGAADLIPYYTAAHTMSTLTCTSTCRSLLDDTSTAAMLTTLGAAPLASPTFTGTVSAPTVISGDNSTKVATTAFVKAQGYLGVTSGQAILAGDGSGGAQNATIDPSLSVSTGPPYTLSCSTAAHGSIGTNLGCVYVASTFPVPSSSYASSLSASGGLTFSTIAVANLSDAASILRVANNLSDISNRVTSINNLGTYFLYTTSQFDKASNNTPSAVTGLTQAVASGEVWHFAANLFITGDATGGIKVRMGSGGSLTATSVHYHIHATCTTTGSTLADTRFADITTNVSYSSGCTSIDVNMDGLVTGNVAGNLSVMFAEMTASGTSSVLVDSNVKYEKLN